MTRLTSWIGSIKRYKKRQQADQQECTETNLASVGWLSILLFAAGLIGIHATGFAKSASDDNCQIIAANKKCIKLVGTWKVKNSESYPRVLEIKATDRAQVFNFMVDAVRGGSNTHIENQFEVKKNIGGYVAASEYQDEKPCAVIFIPVDSAKLEVVSFGSSCSQEHGTSPDGIYIKTK